MKVSLNHIRQYLDFELPPVKELAETINAQLGGIEEIIDLDAIYKDAVIVRVMECKKHPNADKLSICKVDVGENSPYSKFYIPNSNHLVEVVCGAPNVRAGMFAIWLPPGSTVPASFDDKVPFVLDVREIRGIKSHGMLAAADELSIGSDHSGIIDLTDDDLSPYHKTKRLKPGLSFADTFGLNDTIIDIENKMFTHRPDCFGQLGVAREIAGILGKQFTSPAWYGGDKTERPKDQKTERVKGRELPLHVENNAKDVVPRFMAVVIRDVEIKPSPMWIQCGLARLGVKPINNVVDATNAIMLTTAQPTHAYDYDKLRGKRQEKKKEDKILGVRHAKKGESIKLLNGKTYELGESDIVIVDGQGPIGLGGVMGGGNSEVSKTTTNIVLEVATFDMYSVRRSSMRHGIFTEAVSRFNKGQSPLQNPIVLRALMDSIVATSGGQQASDVFDEHATLHDRPVIAINAKDVSNRLGKTFTGSAIASILKHVEFDLADNPKKPGENLEIAVPFWRMDVEILEDVVEEIGRLYGFNKLPRILPRRSAKPTPQNDDQRTKILVRDSLRRAGCNEVLTYSFVHERTLVKAQQDPAQAFRINNALSPDLQYYRISVLPSLLEAIHPNIKSGHDEFVLYEIGKGHNKKYHLDDDDGLPTEMKFIDAVYASKKPKNGAAFYQMRSVLDSLAHDIGLRFIYKKVENPLDYLLTAPFDLARSAIIQTDTGISIGMVGELKAEVIHTFKLPEYSAAMTLDFMAVVAATKDAHNGYQPISKYPSIVQDISLKVQKNVPYEKVYAMSQQTITNRAINSNWSLSPISVYVAPNDPGFKTITLRLVITSYDKTLTEKTVSQLLDDVAKACSVLQS